MALVLCDVGADLILNTFFVATAVQNLKLKLFTNNKTPDANGGDVVGDYTEATGGGYAAITLTRGTGWTITGADDPSDAIYTQQTFTFTGAIGGSGKVYGYYVTDNGGTTLLWAERLAVYFQPANNGDKLLITPKIQMSYGTPAA
jgi:hypothetical protein